MKYTVVNIIDKLKVNGTTYDISQVKRSEMGANNGVATLDNSGKIPSSQLPEAVNDVIEGLMSNGNFYKITNISADYVDLGLPSGTKWATMNVGASSITDYGNYYKYGLGANQYDSAQSKYTGTENPLAATADTATQVWGSQWHTPTRTQIEELIANTTYEWITDYQGSGINGGTFTANGQTLFIPAAGFYGDTTLYDVGKYGYLWSSTPYSNAENSFAIYMYFHNSNKVVANIVRSEGYSIRPVWDAESTPVKNSLVQVTGESGKLYVDKTTGSTYRWNGTAFVEVKALASDVYSWAKQSTKPSYTFDEINDGTTKKWSDKQDVIDDLSTIRSKANNALTETLINNLLQAVAEALTDLDSRINILDDISLSQLDLIKNIISSILSSISQIQSSINTLFSQHSNFVTNSEFQNVLRAVTESLNNLDTRINIIDDIISAS